MHFLLTIIILCGHTWSFDWNVQINPAARENTFQNIRYFEGASGWSNDEICDRKKERSKDIIIKCYFVCVFANFQDKVFSDNPAFWQKEIKKCKAKKFLKIDSVEFCSRGQPTRIQVGGHQGWKGDEGSLTWKCWRKWKMEKRKAVDVFFGQNRCVA